jgi:copper(I)-binding protein
VSRAQHESTRRRTTSAVVGAVVTGMAAAVALAGCGAGQDTQTDSVLPAVSGANGNVGSIAIRNAVIAYPSDGVYPSGGQAPLTLTIVNTGAEADELVEVSSPVAGDVELAGDRSLSPRRTIIVGTPGQSVDPHETTGAVTTTGTPSPTVSPTSGPGTASPTSPTTPASPTSPTAAPGTPSPTTATSEPTQNGRATIVLTGLTEVLRSGPTHPITFVFRNAGAITLQVPIATPATARPEPTGGTPH